MTKIPFNVPRFAFAKQDEKFYLFEKDSVTIFDSIDEFINYVKSIKS